MSVVTEEFLQGEKFQKQLQEIIRNGDANTLTAKLIRNQLEEHFGLEKNSLKPFKGILNEKIEEVYEKIDTEENEQEQQSSNQKKRKAPTIDDQSEEVGEDTETPKTMKKLKKNVGEKKDTDEEEEDNDEDDTFSQSSASSSKGASKKTAQVHTRPTGSDKDEETIKRLKQFINKCGVRKVWSKELSDCKSASAEIKKLRGILTNLGVTGRPSNEKCEAIKKERELKAELDSLDKTLILDNKEENTGSRFRLRKQTQNRPSYKLEESDEEEETSGSENEEEEEEVEEVEEEEESSGDDFEGDSSDEE